MGQEASGSIILRIVATRRTEIAALRTNLVKPAIDRPLCRRAAIVREPARARIGLRLNRLVEIVLVAVRPRIGPRPNRLVEIVPVAVRPQVGHLERVGRTESVIVQHRKRITEIAAVDMAAAEEIMRARAARGAAVAWAAVDSAAAAVEDAAVEEDGVDEETRNEIKNNTYEFVETLHDLRCDRRLGRSNSGD